MYTVKGLIRQVEKDAALIDAVRHALVSMKLIHLGRIQVENTGVVINLQDDIQRLTGALLLLGASD